MVKAKRNQEKVVVTKVYFYGKTKQKKKLVLLKYILMVQTKSKLEKELNTKI